MRAFTNELDSYLKKRYKRPLYQLSKSEGAELIQGFQMQFVQSLNHGLRFTCEQKTQISENKSPGQNQTHC